MRLTGKNRKEMQLLSHYMPEFLKSVAPDDTSIELYFDWSDRGKGKDVITNQVHEENRTKRFTYLSALFYGKRNRDLAITSYLLDWGETCTAADFVEEPEEVAEFVAKALNKPMIVEIWRNHAKS